MRKTILIVDDRIINLEFLSMLLDYAGYLITKANNGAEALELARATPPALVITDIRMPVMDGTELVRQLRIDPATAHIPVIFYTATYNANEAGMMAQSLGVAAVLTKPAEPQNILDTVSSALGNAYLPPADSLPTVVAALQQHVPLQPLAVHAAPVVAGWLNQTTHTLDSMHTLSLRLAALLELSVTLSAERQTERLLTLFCRAAQNIMNVTHAAIGMRDTGGKRRSASCGLASSDVDAIFDVLDSATSVLGQRFAGCSMLDIGDVQADPELQQLVTPHPLASRFLIVPVKTRSHLQGWFYLAGNLGANDFDVKDQEFAMTLAVQLAPLFENLIYFEEVQQHVGRLKAEACERERVTAQLQQSEAALRRAQILTKSAHIVIGEDGVFESWSTNLLQLIGVTGAGMPLTLQAWLDIVNPADRARLADYERAARQSGMQMEVGYRVERRNDGATIEIQHVLEPLAGPVNQDAKRRCFHTLQDMTEQKLQERKMARLSRISAVLGGINAAILRIHDRHALFQEACQIAVNQGAFGMAWIGTIDPQTLDGQVLASASAGGMETHVDNAGFSTRAGKPGSDTAWSVAVRELRPVTCNDIRKETIPPQLQALLGRGYQALAAFPLMLDNHAVAVMTLFSDEANIFDDEERKLLSNLAADLSFGLSYIDKEEKLSYLAYYDALTGQPNRMLFHDRLAQFLRQAKQGASVTCVILLDLDHFSQLNDVLGRHSGDAVLQQVAARLRTTLIEPYSLARISGDIFAITIPALQQTAAALLEQQVFCIFDKAFTIEQQEVRVTARAGLALYPEDGENAETLFKHAEIALKKAKSSDERYLYYAPQMNAALAAKLALKSELRQALDTRQFEVYYQPRIDLRSGRIVSAEALIRWIHPQRGIVPPDQFIPLTEETGLIVPIGAWVIDDVCAQQTAWLAQRVGIVPVAVNLSAVQFNKGVAMQTIGEALERHGLDTKFLEFELTESVVMSDPEKASLNLHSLKKNGP